jgi:hypothetical protein
VPKQRRREAKRLNEMRLEADVRGSDRVCRREAGFGF